MSQSFKWEKKDWDATKKGKRYKRGRVVKVKGKKKKKRKNKEELDG